MCAIPLLGNIPGNIRYLGCCGQTSMASRLKNRSTSPSLPIISRVANGSSPTRRRLPSAMPNSMCWLQRRLPRAPTRPRAGGAIVLPDTEMIVSGVAEGAARLAHRDAIKRGDKEAGVVWRRALRRLHPSTARSSTRTWNALMPRGADSGHKPTRQSTSNKDSQG